MQLFIKINNKTQVMNIDNNEENKMDKLNELVEELTHFNRNFFWLKSNGHILNSSTILKNEDNIEILFKTMQYQKLYIETDIVFYIPNNILLESKIIVSLLDPLEEFDSSSEEIFNNISDSNKLIFDSKEILDKKTVNEWINLSIYLTTFLTEKGITKNDFKIERPLTNKKISVYIGDLAYEYLEKMELDNLKKLATLADYLDISYLLEIICAFIAEKFVKNKSIEDIKKLDLI